MAGDRENGMEIVTGEQGVGKSNETLRRIYKNIIPSGRKALILDINNEYEKYRLYHRDGTSEEVRIKRILHKDILAFSAQEKIECARVIPYYDNSNKFMSEDDIDAYWVRAINMFHGGLLMLEDLNKVFGDVLPKRLAGVLTNKRHRDADIIVHMQSIGRVLPKMRQNCEQFRFHHQLDEVDDSENKLTGNFLRVFKIAELLIGKQYKAGQALLRKNPKDELGDRLIRKFVYIHRKRNNIIGGFDKRMLYDACVEFLSRNAGEYMHIYNQTDVTGKRMYSKPQAMHLRAMELLQMFWGN